MRAIRPAAPVPRRDFAFALGGWGLGTTGLFGGIVLGARYPATSLAETVLLLLTVACGALAAGTGDSSPAPERPRAGGARYWYAPRARWAQGARSRTGVP